MKKVNISDVLNIICDAIDRADIAQNSDVNPEDEYYISGTLTGGYPQRGIVEFTTKKGDRSFRIEITEEED